MADPTPGWVRARPLRSDHLCWSDIEAIRTTSGRSVLLFVTDRCPVGCAHCSVDSRRDSPTITDFALFEGIVNALCTRADIAVVGVSGGEPFVEKRGLRLATARLAAAGKRTVIYTSGVWGRPTPPSWVCEVLRRTSTVVLSTDSFHANGVDDQSFIHAARSIADAGAWIVVQVIDEAGMVERARSLLQLALGDRYDLHAQLNITAPLTHGRGASVFRPTTRTAGKDFGACGFLASPTVRYDGMVSGCCNESVLMGLGPASLRRRARSGAELAGALDELTTDPLLRTIATIGIGPLTLHPRFGDLAERKFTSICDTCWVMLDRVSCDTAPDALIDALHIRSGAS